MKLTKALLALAVAVLLVGLCAQPTISL